MKHLVEKRVIEYIRSLIPDYSQVLMNLEKNCRHKGIPIIETEVAQFLVLLLKSKGCKNVLEIGTAVGFSAILMAETIQPFGGMVTTIEKDNEILLEAQENIKRAGLEDSIKLILGDASEILPTIKGSYDFVFLDAAKGQYWKFYRDISRLLEPGGLLVADNVLYRGLVIPGSKFRRRKKTMVVNLRKFLRELKEDPNWVASVLPLGDGVVVALREGDGKDGF